MVVKSFESGISALLPFDAQTHRLMAEWSPGHLHLILRSTENEAPLAVESYAGEMVTAAALDEIAAQSRLLQYREVPLTFYNAAPRGMPIPQQVFDKQRAEQEATALWGYQPALQSIASQVAQHQLWWVSQLPEAVYNWATQQFDRVQFSHTIAATLATPMPADRADIAQVLVYHGYAWAIFYRGTKLLFAWAIPLLTPDDLAYRLLNVCAQHELDQHQIRWQIGGMLEKDAPLYLALSKFLHHIELPTSHADLAKDVPGHYIAHLLALAP